MSDVSPDTTIGDVVDTTNSSVASVAADGAAAKVVDAIPDTQVVVEDNVTDPESALVYADRIREIAREEANTNMLAWIALAESNKPVEEPKIVVVDSPSPPPAAPVVEPPVEKKPKADVAPPKTHAYFRPIGKSKRDS